MPLPTNVVSEFAKITNDNKQQKTETTIQGTVEVDKDRTYVRIDGSKNAIPVRTGTTTADIKAGDRVTIMIKNHTATVTGNLTDPSARTTEVGEINSKVERLNIEEISAKVAEFEELAAKKVDVEDFNAEKAKIETLQTEKLGVEEAGITYATIERMKTAEASIEDLEAKKANIEELDGKYANIDFSNIENASIWDLYVNSGIIKNLTSSDATFTGELTGVTISGDLLKANTVVAEKIVIKGGDGLLYKFNTDGLKAIDDCNVFGEDICQVEENITNVEWLDDHSATITMGGTELVAIYFRLDPEKTYVLSYECENCGIDILGSDWETIYTTEDNVVTEKIITGAEHCYFVGIDRVNKSTYTFRNVSLLDKALYDINRLDGKIIAAKSIAATKISVDDLVAFDATIGGFRITDESIYSGVKESVNNTTRGIYFNRYGEIAFGDSNNFVKYYRDEDGNWHLDMSVDKLTITGGDVPIGGRNLYLGTRNFDGNKWTNLDQWETWDSDGFGYREYGRYGAWLGLGQYVDVKAGETYTFSFYARGNENSEITIYTTQDHTETTPGSLYIGNIPDEYKRYHFTFKVNHDCTIYPRVENMTDEGWIQIYGLKLEKGSIPTDWTPAPEDAESDIAEAAKTATNFMQYDATDGLQLGNKTSGSWSGFRAQITSAAYNILNEVGEILASYGASLIELGKNSVNAVIKLCGGMGEIRYNSDENYLDISSDSIRLKGTEMSSVEAGYTDSSGTKRSSAVHVSPTEVQIRSGVNSSGSWNDCWIRVTPDEVKVSGFVYDNDTGGYYESFVEGTSGIWTYRKWKSGKVELWGEYSVSTKSCSAALGNWYRTTSFTIGNFPFTVYNPKLVANYESTGFGGLLWPTTSTTTSSPPEYYLIRPTSGNVNGTIHIYVVGEWTN